MAGTTDALALDSSGEATASDVAALTSLTVSDRVLEIGCGVGRVGAKLAPRCRTWTGADVSANMLAHTRAAIVGMGNASVLQLNGTDLYPLADGSMDIVYWRPVRCRPWERSKGR